MPHITDTVSHTLISDYFHDSIENVIDSADIDTYSSEQTGSSQPYFHPVSVSGLGGEKGKGKGQGQNGFSLVSGEDEETSLLGLGLELE